MKRSPAVPRPWRPEPVASRRNSELTPGVRNHHRLLCVFAPLRETHFHPILSPMKRSLLLAVFIATPEYNGGVPPLLVNTVTWISRQKPSPFRHAVFGIGGVSSGKYGTIWSLSHLRDSLTKVGTLIVPTLLGIGPAETAFDDKGDPVEPAIIRKVETMVTELTHFSRG